MGGGTRGREIGGNVLVIFEVGGHGGGGVGACHAADAGAAVVELRGRGVDDGFASGGVGEDVAAVWGEGDNGGGPGADGGGVGHFGGDRRMDLILWLSKLL